MGSILGVVLSPIFLGSLVMLGLICLARVLLARNPRLKRYSEGDRRAANKMSTFPLHDSEGVLVSENRRIHPDRRHPRLLAMQHEMTRGKAVG